MRATPLAVWLSKMESEDDMYTAVYLQSYFTHCNKVAIDSCFLYCLAIKYILNGNTDSADVFNKVKRVADIRGMEQMVEWFNEIENDNLPDPTKAIGWLKIAFCYAFYYLKQNTSYMDAMHDILSYGGDTDTNACIVGGLIGAIKGPKDIPVELVRKVLDFRCDTKEDMDKFKGRKRPPIFVPGHVLTEENLKSFFENIPTKLTVTLDGQDLNADEIMRLTMQYPLS